MAKVPISVDLFQQHHSRPAKLFQKILTLIESDDLERVRFSSAYARWDGIGLIAPQLEAFLRGGGEFQSIYGVANGVTTPDCLLYSLYLQELYESHTYAGVVEDKYANSIFHPKFFEFRFPDRNVVILGSANLTGGGLNRNTELVTELQMECGGALDRRVERAWREMKLDARKVSLKLVRGLKDDAALGDERDRGESRSKPQKPFLRSRARVATKPLFSRVLDLEEPAKRSKIFAKLDPISERPDRLYLQILKYETGGQGTGHPGYQIQLPVGTLATYFGVGVNQKRAATFRFGKEVVDVHLTHFSNNTHRIRLLPVRDIARPAIVVFERLGESDYRCSIVPPSRYARTLATKCHEQTRAGARRWGLE